MTASSHPQSAKAWDRSRILVATLLLSVAQGVLFVSVARWPRLPDPRPGESFSVRVTLQPSDIQGADGWSADPRQFSSSHHDGIASGNPIDRSTREYPLFRWESSPRWLGVSPEVLWRPGTGGTSVKAHPLGTEVAGPIPAASTRPPVLKGETSVSIRGDLTPLRLEDSPPPPQSQVDDILPPTVIEVVVGPAGDVVRARLATGSGNPDADRAALSWVRGLRFATASGATGSGAKDLASSRTGDLVVHWNTRPAPQR